MKRKNVRTYFYYTAVIILAVGVYYWFNNLGENIVKALLDFYTTVVEIFLNNNHYYIEELGYYAGNAYTIGKECLGLGIIALIFGCCGVLSVKMLHGYKRLLGVFVSAPVAIVTGVFVNILRLISSIYFITFARFELIHALLGIVIYLCVLFFYYRFFIWLSNRSPKEDEDTDDGAPGNEVIEDGITEVEAIEVDGFDDIAQENVAMEYGADEDGAAVVDGFDDVAFEYDSTKVYGFDDIAQGDETADIDGFDNVIAEEEASEDEAPEDENLMNGASEDKDLEDNAID